MSNSDAVAKDRLQSASDQGNASVTTLPAKQSLSIPCDVGQSESEEAGSAISPAQKQVGTERWFKRAQQRLGKQKITLWVMGITVVPVLAMVAVLYGYDQVLESQLMRTDRNRLESPATVTLWQQRQFLYLAGVGTVIVAGTLALFKGRQLQRSLGAIAASSRDLAQKLGGTPSTPLQDALITTTTNLQVLARQIPDVLQLQQRADTILNQLQAFAQQLQHCSTQDAAFHLATSTVQDLLEADRVIIGCYCDRPLLQVVAEATTLDLPPLLHQILPGMAGGAEDGSLTIAVTERDRLDPWAGQAALVVLLIHQGEPWGELMVHHCRATRQWLPSEKQVLTQVAMLLGLALEQADLMIRLATAQDNAQHLAALTRCLQGTQEQSTLLKRAVVAIRNSLSCDRVLIYRLDSNQGGTIVAESVRANLPKTLWTEIQEPCFAEGLAQWHMGQTHVMPTLTTHELPPSTLHQLQTWAVEANLIVPLLLQDQQLFGLLMLQDCTQARHWQPSTLEVVVHMATQISISLDQVGLLAQTQSTCQTIQQRLNQQQQQHKLLRSQMANLLDNSRPQFQALVADTTHQTQLLGTLEHYSQVIVGLAQRVDSELTLEMQKRQDMHQMAQVSLNNANHIHTHLEHLQTLTTTVATLMDEIVQPMATMHDTLKGLSEQVAQMKLQAMNTTLEASRLGDAGHHIAAVGDQAHRLARQLETDLARLQPLITKMQDETQVIANQIHTSQTEFLSGRQWVTDVQQHLHQVADHIDQVNSLTQQTAQIAVDQVQMSANTHDVVLELSTLARQICAQTQMVSAVFEELNHMGQSTSKRDSMA